METGYLHRAEFTIAGFSHLGGSNPSTPGSPTLTPYPQPNRTHTDGKATIPHSPLLWWSPLGHNPMGILRRTPCIFYEKWVNNFFFLPTVSQTKDLEQRGLPSQISGSTTERGEKTACGECEPTEPLIRILQWGKCPPNIIQVRQVVCPSGPLQPLSPISLSCPLT